MVSAMKQLIYLWNCRICYVKSVENLEPFGDMSQCSQRPLPRYLSVTFRLFNSWCFQFNYSVRRLVSAGCDSVVSFRVYCCFGSVCLLWGANNAKLFDNGKWKEIPLMKSNSNSFKVGPSFNHLGSPVSLFVSSFIPMETCTLPFSFVNKTDNSQFGRVYQTF